MKGRVTPTSPVGAPDSARADGFCENPRSCTTRSTAARVSGATCGCRLSTREIVATETPASRAISRIVGGRPCKRLLIRVTIGARPRASDQ